MACRLPVLITDKVNIWQEFANAGAGLVESDDVEGCTRLFQRWAAVGEGGRQMVATNARRCYENHFEINLFAKRLVDFVADQIGRRRPASEPRLRAGASA